MALVLPFFLLLVLSVLHYGVLFTVQQGLTLAAEEGARACVSVSPSVTDYSVQVCQRAQSVARSALAWMPSHWSARIQVTCTPDLSTVPGTVSIQVSYPDYADAPPIPALKSVRLPLLPDLPTLPPLPRSLGAGAAIQI